MITIMTAQTKTILHLDKCNRAIIIYNDGAHNHKVDRCIWTAQEDGSTWVKYCEQWNRVYKCDNSMYVDGMYKDNVYDPDSYAQNIV